MTTTDDALKALVGDLAAVDGSTLATLSATVRAAGARAGAILTPDLPPVPLFLTTVSGLTVNFDGSNSSDPDGTVTAYAWDFGDHATGAGRTVRHDYTAGGTYSTVLTVTDNSGSTASLTRPVVVTAPLPAGVLHVTKIAVAGPAVAGAPVVLAATLQNDTTSPIAYPGVGFYDPSGKELCWGASATTLGAGQSVTIDSANSTWHSAPWVPALAGTIQVTARCGSNGAELATSALTSPITVTGTLPPPPPPSGARDVTKWPYASDSPWNLPMCSGATFGPNVSGGSPFVLSDAPPGYEPAVYVATSSDPLVTVTVAQGSFPGVMTMRCPAGARVPYPPGGDGHMTVIQPDGHSAFAFWAFAWTGPATATAGSMAPDDQNGAGWGIGWVRAAGVAGSAGSVRAEEAAAGKIPHALAFGCPGQGVYGGTAGGPVWPAAPFYDHAGEGQLLAIPPNTPKPALSAAGSALWDACRDYGCYDVDTTGGGGDSFVAELHVPQAWVDQANGDVTTIMRACRLVTNASQATPKGPGTPVAPLAPAV